jgi:hypothetical protein
MSSSDTWCPSLRRQTARHCAHVHRSALDNTRIVDLYVELLLAAPCDYLHWSISTSPTDAGMGVK